MTRYVTKTRFVEAIRWNGRGFDGDAPKWVLDALLAEGHGKVWRKGDSLYIATDREAEMVRPGWWLIRLDTGRLIALDKHEFEVTYEQVVEAAPAEESAHPVQRRRLGIP